MRCCPCYSRTQAVRLAIQALKVSLLFKDSSSEGVLAIQGLKQ